MPFLHQGDAEVGLLEALDGKLRSWQEAGPGCGPIHGSLVHLVKQVCMGQEGLAGLGAAAQRHNDGVEIMPHNREYGQEVAGLATEFIACLVFAHHPAGKQGW